MFTLVVFKGTNIFQTDNYEIIRDLSSSIYLDDVIMPLQSFKRDNIPYWLINHEQAKVKTKKVYHDDIEERKVKGINC